MTYSQAAPKFQRELFVIGSSEGGIPVLENLLTKLPADLPACLVVVQHLAPSSRGTLVELFNRKSDLEISTPSSRSPILPGRVYFAPPNRHLLVDGDHVILSSGARENRCRPAADPLFRTAAISYGSRVAGVILSGNLDDGASGLENIKQCGGTSIIQKPSDALVPEMPESALKWVSEIDHQVSQADLPDLVSRLAGEPVGDSPEPPKTLRLEVSLMLDGNLGAERMDGIGALSPYSCPDCGGPLWEIDSSGASRFRCHTGHAFTSESLQEGFSRVTESSLWVALRTLEERARMLDRLGEKMSKRKGKVGGKNYTEEAQNIRSHAIEIRRLLDTHSGR